MSEVTITTGQARKTTTRQDARVSIDPRVFRTDQAAIKVRTEVYGKPVQVRLGGESLKPALEALAGVQRMKDEARSEAEQFVAADKRGDTEDARFHAGRLHGLLDAVALVERAGYWDKTRDRNAEAEALVSEVRERLERQAEAARAIGRTM